MLRRHPEPQQPSRSPRLMPPTSSPAMLLLAACCLLVPRAAAAGEAPTVRPVTLFVAGDAMLGRGAASDLRLGHTPLQRLAAQSRSADIAFCNLECVFDPTAPPPGWKPRLFASPGAARYLRMAGIDLVSTANNHALDAGQAGAAATLRTLQENGIAQIGLATAYGGSWQPWEASVGGRRIAWLAASAWGPWRSGSARVRNLAGSGLTDQVRALARSGDAVFVSLHWGNEYERAVTAGQVQIARRLIDAGAIAVIGHHPHVAQRVEIYHGRPIFYSLGNFVFDRLPGRMQDGIAARITLLPSGQIEFRILALNSTESRGVPQSSNHVSSQANFSAWPELRVGEVSGAMRSIRLSASEFTPEWSRTLPQPGAATCKAVSSKQTPSQRSPSVPLPLPSGETLVKALPARFSADPGSRQVIVWSQNPGGQATLRAFERLPGTWRCLAEGHHPAMFDLQVGDVDRQGRDEIVLGLLQRSKLDIRIARRLFVYSVAGGQFKPRWRGSALSRPFQSFRLLPTRTGCDLAAVENDRAPDLRDFQWISVYRWSGFGFRRLWTTPVRGSVQNLQTGRDGQGSFITFTQLQPQSRRRLILRRASAATDALETDLPFVARALAPAPPTPTNSEKQSQADAAIDPA